ncbi:MAG TPA: serine protease [Urbifossiella sp.]|nr:serine protease [Urbifossiella sp.]
MTPGDEDRIVGVITRGVMGSPQTPVAYFRDLLARTRLPNGWRPTLAHIGAGAPDADARLLVTWALNQGGNPADPEAQTLGSILYALLGRVGVEDARLVVVLLTRYRLFNGAQLSAIKARYQVPEAAGATDPPADFGPPITWGGPAPGSVELEGFFQPVPDLLDVGFLKRALGRTNSVCRVEIPGGAGKGTGVLITPRLVLTNYHVLAEDGGEGPLGKPAGVVLRFGCFSLADGGEATGEVFRLDPNQPILAQSQPGALDYVLLRVEARITEVEGIRPAQTSTAIPGPRTGLHILQHPLGASMKVSMTHDGVTWVSEPAGKLQYVTQTKGGSSGSPCFDDNWNMVALHHAQRGTTFGSIREGILFRSIQAEIQGHLV